MSAPGEPIRTERLALPVMPTRVLRALADRKDALDEGRPGAPVTWPGLGEIPDEVADHLPATFLRGILRATPAERPWLVRGIVLDDPVPRLVGDCGGHGAPDPDGVVEGGYHVVGTERGRGIATEAMTAWFGWAHAHGARRGRLVIDPDNDPSNAVAERLGFTVVRPAGPAGSEATWEADLPLPEPT